MKPNVCLVCLLAIIHFATAFKVTQNEENSIDNHIEVLDRSLTNEFRIKRQLENFEEDYPTASAQDGQEEPGFWDRVIKVAVKLFNRFVEWLNS